MSGALDTEVLGKVSRSFYLTLRLLPREMRGAASLGYLLARTSDTLADTEGVLVGERRRLLAAFGEAVLEGRELPLWPEEVKSGATPGEIVLLERTPEVLGWLGRIGQDQAGLIREVVSTIISGQMMDLTAFANGTANHPATLPDAQALDDYTWRVAGCVGAFWTKLGYLTLGRRFSRADEGRLLEMGIAYGKALQLVNILRDLPRDLANGRCYLPVAGSGDRSEIMAEFQVWHRRAVAGVEQGRDYAATLRSRRLRAATVLPALIAEDTLDAMEDASWEELEKRVKVSRLQVYRSMIEAFLF